MSTLTISCVINEMTVEIDGAEKPACVAESVLRIVF